MTRQERLEILTFGAAFAAGIAPILLILNHINRPDLMVPTLGSAAAIVTAIKVYPEFRQRIWFWTTMAVIVGLHIFLVVDFPWQAGWIPAPLITIVYIVDFVVIVGVIRLIAKLGEQHPE